MSENEIVFQLRKSLPKFFRPDYDPPDWAFRDGFYHVAIRKFDSKTLQAQFDDITITIRVYGIDDAKESRCFEEIANKNPFSTLILYSLKRCIALYKEKGLKYAANSDELDLLRSSLECLSERELELLKVLTEPYQSFIEDFNLIRLLPSQFEGTPHKDYGSGISVLTDLDSTKPTIAHLRDQSHCLANDFNFIRHSVEQIVLHKPNQILSSYGPTSHSDGIMKEDLEMTLDFSDLLNFS